MHRFEGIGGGDIHAAEAISFEVWFSHDGHRYFSLSACVSSGLGSPCHNR